MAAPLSSSSAHNAAVSKAPAGKGSNRSVEEIYQKKSQLEHILLRPDTYVGSTEKLTSLQPIISDCGQMEFRNLTYVPGLYKIFDEILVNAADNYRRDSTQNTIRVDIDGEAGTIRVYNNGAGVPVEIHKEEKVYVPELIFGHLLTSSNYDDDERKVTGGRNGYGAKLANIFSTEFVIETCDGSRKKRYRQVFRENMSEKGKPVITACKSTDNWTCITFKPDLPKFHMDHLEDETVQLMRRRVFDIAGALGKGVKVFLNGERVPVKNFGEYAKLYLAPGAPCISAKVNDRWEVCISASDGQFQQMSFVNSIATTRGGTHIAHIADQVAAKLLEHIKKKHKNTKLKPFQIKNHLSIFANCLIENPAFDSQTKETLTSRPSTFGSKCDFQDKFFKDLFKTEIVENILAWANFKQSKDLKKTDGSKRQRLTGIPKLDDANDAGGRNSQSCTLILTEGDSAKALAISGLSVVGRDKFGVFPLRGKLLNVRDASHDQIMKNAEIQNIKQILGLQQGKQYTDTKSLRYGHLMIMTDQDHDGSHIKGLLINFLHHFFPSLLKLPGFLLEFITPIVKASKGKTTQTFYTMPEYEEFIESLNGSTRGWSIKYYKGLGTSTAKEAKEYFSEIQKNKKSFYYSGSADDDNIEMAFSKKRVDDRKTWLKNVEPGTFLDHTASEIGYSDFVNKELVLFSLADLQRSIPSMVDGLKPGQRKILYCGFKRNLKKDIKVAQLAGYVSEHAAYHHGETSLASTIVGLAQDFVGTNNINILYPSGQFGTRLQGGKDAASPRYIYTRLAALTRYLFPEADDPQLKYLVEEGQSIEPEAYVPILPTVLVNGSEGIGTGWSSFIPNYNPEDVIDNIKCLMREEPMTEMHPWYCGFKGEISRNATKKNSEGSSSYSVSGVYNIVNETTLEITELPIRKWTQDYKEFLEGLMKPEKKNEAPFITDYREYHTDVSVHFVITMPAENLAAAEKEGIEKKFKLSTTISTSNMMLFNSEGVITKYDNPNHILEDFYTIRLDAYVKRRATLLLTANEEMKRASNKIRFIKAVINDQLVISKRKKSAIIAELKDEGYDEMTTKSISNSKAASATNEDDGAENEGDLDAAVTKTVKIGYEYLLNMPLWNLTEEKIQELENDRQKKEQEVSRLNEMTPENMWEEDLDSFLEAYTEVEQGREMEERRLMQQQKRAGKARQAAAKKTAKGKKKKAIWEGESDQEDDDPFEEDDFDDDDMTKYTKPIKKSAKGTTSRATSVSAMSVDNAGDRAEVSSQLTTSVKAPSSAAPAKKKKLGAKVAVSTAMAKAVSKPIESVDLAKEEDSEDEFMVPLSERLARFNMKKDSTTSNSNKATIKSSAKSAASTKTSKATSKAVAKKNARAGNEEAVSPSGALPAKKVKKCRSSPFHKGSGVPPIVVDDSDSDSDEDASVISVEPREMSRRAAKPSKITYRDESSDEDASDFEEDCDEASGDDWSP